MQGNGQNGFTRPLVKALSNGVGKNLLFLFAGFFLGILFMLFLQGYPEIDTPPKQEIHDTFNNQIN